MSETLHISDGSCEPIPLPPFLGPRDPYAWSEPGKLSLAHHTVHAGEALDILRQLPSDLFDAVIPDEPYSSGGYVRGDRAKPITAKYLDDDSPWHGTRGFMGDSRDQRSWAYWCALWLSEALRVTKPGGYGGLFCDWRQLPAATDSLQAGGWQWRGIVVWDKGESARAPHTGYFRHQAEYFVWGTKGHLEPAKHGGPFPGVIRCHLDWRAKRHPTAKPVDLMRQLVRCVPPGGLVLDPFAGSGSTLVGAMLEGRRGVGIEIDPITAREANEWLDSTRQGLAPAETEAGQRGLWDQARAVGPLEINRTGGEPLDPRAGTGDAPCDRTCKVCCAPCSDGRLEHGRGCYQVDPNGGGWEACASCGGLA